VTLHRIFLEHAAPAAVAAVSSPEALEEPLGGLLAAGQAAWPTIALEPASFLRFLARQLPPEVLTPAGLAALRAGDLYLVCALGLGHPEALAVFASDLMPAVERALGRIQTSEAAIKDIIQGLYGYLLERQNAPPETLELRRGYAGRGELKGWLCTCAVHQAGRLQKRERRELDLDETPNLVLPDKDRTPELALLTGELKARFESAFREAVATLSSRERNLLRYHFLSGLSVDQIGVIYRVHRATAARWVAQARERLSSLTRKRFLAAAPMREQSYAEAMALVRSQLALNLATLLKQVTAGEPALPKVAADE